jgi:phosphohistidine phosphatase SixA
MIRTTAGALAFVSARVSGCAATLGAVLLLALAMPASADAGLSGAPLLKALRHGGLVIVMRHTSSPREVPDREHADPENITPERQLDATGRETATAMGKALRDLKIPVTQVFVSPAYRAQQTVRLAQLTATTRSELAQPGSGMQAADDTQTRWLQQQAKLLPKTGNTLLVTHFPNISAAFPAESTDLADGEALVFGSDGKGGSTLLARIKIEDWSKLGQ